MSCPAQHTLCLGTQGKDMARTAEILGRGFLASECQNGLCPVVGRYAGGTSVCEQVDGDSERSGMNGTREFD